MENAWVRPAVMAGGNGAGYLVIRNTGSEDDTLLGAKAVFANTVEVHETVVGDGAMPAEGEPMAGEGGDHMQPESEEAMAGMMSMRPVESIPVPAGGSVELKPGSYHIMLIDQPAPPAEGRTVTLTLVFEKAGEVTVEAEVRME
mgnify:FL=1